MPGAIATLAASYAAGSLPVANLAARLSGGPDLRQVGAGTVSGSALYAVSGFGPLAAAGLVELGKGALGPLLAGRSRPLLGAGAAALAICAHNWSPWLRFRGGRGVSLLLGATGVLAPEATVLLAAGLGAGRLLERTGEGTLAALVALPALLARRQGAPGLLSGAVLVAPVLAKRLLGNDGRLPRSRAALLGRLARDSDLPAKR